MAGGQHFGRTPGSDDSELGHLLTAITLGFHQVRLHYESVTYADQGLFWQLMQSGAQAQAEALSPFWKVAVVEITGLAACAATVSGMLIGVPLYYTIGPHLLP